MPASLRISRRSVVPLLGGLALSVAGRAKPAGAGISWCMSDPIVRLGGTRLQFWVSILAEDLPFVTGPVACRVLTAKGVSREVLFIDAGFNGYGETVAFGDMASSAQPGAPFPASVWVDVPNSKQGSKFLIVLEIVPENGAPIVGTGNAGSTEIRFTVEPTVV
jgi:hypothetical protein